METTRSRIKYLYYNTPIYNAGYGQWTIEDNFLSGWGYNPYRDNTHREKGEGKWRDTYNELWAGIDNWATSTHRFTIVQDSCYTDTSGSYDKYTDFDNTNWRNALVYICQYENRGQHGTLFRPGDLNQFHDWNDYFQCNISISDSGDFDITADTNATYRTGKTSIGTNSEVSNWYWLSSSSYCNVEVYITGTWLIITFTYTPNSKTHSTAYTVQYCTHDNETIKVNCAVDIDVVCEAANYVVINTSVS